MSIEKGDQVTFEDERGNRLYGIVKGEGHNTAYLTVSVGEVEYDVHNCDLNKTTKSLQNPNSVLL